MSFDELVQRFMRGDPNALVEIDRKFGPRTRGILRRQFAGRLRRLEIDDVLQDALVCAWEQRDQFDPNQGSLPAWFFGISRNTARRLARSGWLQQRTRETESDFKRSVAPNQVLDGDGQAEPCACPKAAALAQGLAALTDRQRTVLIAKFSGVPIDEIAKEFGISPSTARNTALQAMARLRARLAELGHPPPPEPR